MKYIVGIDEVGRGPLAGPVTVGVVVCRADIYIALKRDKRLPGSGKDSKKLSHADREKYSKMLKHLAKEKKISFVVTHISQTIIDSKGISFAIKKAMRSGIQKLKIDPKQTEIRLDGSLHAPAEFTNQKTIIKGDEKEKIIAWASILAKVSRDALMCRHAKKFPQYGFEIHKGYGTAKHRNTIQTHGFSILHRKSFCKNII
ncbi:MAG: ribonuclease HII [Patescibacteria group bacterium]